MNDYSVAVPSSTLQQHRMSSEDISNHTSAISGNQQGKILDLFCCKIVV